FIGVEWGNCYDRAEDFFLEDACFWVHVVEDCVLYEVALYELFLTLATSNQLYFLLTNLDVGGDLVVVLWVNQCADLGLRIGWQTNLDALSLRCVALHELVVDAALNQDACASGATLAVAREDAEDGGIDSCVQVGIIEAYGGGLATEFHRQSIEVRRCVGERDVRG